MTDYYKYYIIDTKTKAILHTASTDYMPDDKEQLKALLANSVWTPLFIVHKYLTDPNSVTIVLADDSKLENIKPKRTQKKKHKEN